jgi:hypothetical protein
MGYFKNLDIDEMNVTQDAVTEMVNNSYEVYGSYSHAAGVLQVMLEQCIHELPKERRSQYRAQLYRLALDQKKQLCRI